MDGVTVREWLLPRMVFTWRVKPSAAITHKKKKHKEKQNLVHVLRMKKKGFYCLFGTKIITICDATHLDQDDSTMLHPPLFSSKNIKINLNIALTLLFPLFSFLSLLSFPLVCTQVIADGRSQHEEDVCAAKNVH
jgi:hypothetical protein